MKPKQQIIKIHVNLGKDVDIGRVTQAIHQASTRLRREGKIEVLVNGVVNEPPAQPQTAAVAGTELL